jgi:hypothetical protein
MTAAITVAANFLFYIGYTKLKSQKIKQKKREHEIAFSKYEQKIGDVKNYLRDNKLF